MCGKGCSSAPEPFAPTFTRARTDALPVARFRVLFCSAVDSYDVILTTYETLVIPELRCPSTPRPRARIHSNETLSVVLHAAARIPLVLTLGI